MRTSLLLAALAATMATPAAFADPPPWAPAHGWRDGPGKHKEEFRDGDCKVKREWKKDGGYKEKIKCKGGDEYEREYDGRAVRVVPAQPAVTYRSPPWIVQQQGQYVYQPRYRPAAVAGTSRCNSATVGSVLGGLVGGVLGNQIGQGDGRTLATIGGAVAGVLVGGEIGRRMDAANQACVGEVLEVAPTGRRVQWAQGPVTYAAVPGRSPIAGRVLSPRTRSR